MQSSTGIGSPRTAGDTARGRDVDWDAAVQGPAFRELRRSRQRFVVPAVTGGLTWMLLWVVLIAYAPDFMGESVYEGLTVGYVTGLSQYVLVWVLAWLYLRRARDVWAPLQRKAIESLGDAGEGRSA